jgi:hypothetical protein
MLCYLSPGYRTVGGPEDRTSFPGDGARPARTVFCAPALRDGARLGGFGRLASGLGQTQIEGIVGSVRWPHGHRLGSRSIEV